MKYDTPKIVKKSKDEAKDLLTGSDIIIYNYDLEIHNEEFGVYMCRVRVTKTHADDMGKEETKRYVLDVAMEKYRSANFMKKLDVKMENIRLNNPSIIINGEEVGTKPYDFKVVCYPPLEPIVPHFTIPEEQDLVSNCDGITIKISDVINNLSSQIDVLNDKIKELESEKNNDKTNAK